MTCIFQFNSLARFAAELGPCTKLHEDSFRGLTLRALGNALPSPGLPRSGCLCPLDTACHIRDPVLTDPSYTGSRRPAILSWGREFHLRVRPPTRTGWTHDGRPRPPRFVFLFFLPFPFCFVSRLFCRFSPFRFLPHAPLFVRIPRCACSPIIRLAR